MKISAIAPLPTPPQTLINAEPILPFPPSFGNSPSSQHSPSLDDCLSFDITVSLRGYILRSSATFMIYVLGILPVLAALLQSASATPVAATARTDLVAGRSPTNATLQAAGDLPRSPNEAHKVSY